MQITKTRPFASGVTRLMYVGDDDAVEHALGMTADERTWLWIFLAGLGVGYLLRGSLRR